MEEFLLKLPEDLLQHPVVDFAVDVSVAFSTRDFAKFFRLWRVAAANLDLFSVILMGRL